MIIEPADRLSGTEEYYFSKKLDEVRKMRSQGIDVINLGIGSPDLAPSSETIEAATKALKNEKNHGYASYRSSPELRQELARFYERVYHVKLNAETEILPLLGSKEGILYTSLAFVNPGESILVPNPGYPAYSSVARMIGANVVYYDLKEENDWLPDFEKLEKQDLGTCKIMWVNYPHMPTGRPATAELFKNLVSFAKKKKILICHDNPYSLVLNETPPLSILSFDPQKEYSLELNSFSKAFNMAGWRVGLLSGSEAVVNTVLQVKSNVDSGMFTAVQMGAIEALKNPESWHEARNGVYRKRRALVWNIFDKLGLKYDPKQVGLFVWARVPDQVGKVETYVDRILYEARVFFVPGSVFGSNGSKYVRSSLCASEDVLKEALSRIEAWAQGERQ
jgi:aspartate/methionine/tyrosine aminotransferase